LPVFLLFENWQPPSAKTSSRMLPPNNSFFILPPLKQF
jgi:hypothetical protein